MSKTATMGVRVFNLSYLKAVCNPRQLWHVASERGEAKCGKVKINQRDELSAFGDGHFYICATVLKRVVQPEVFLRLRPAQSSNR